MSIWKDTEGLQWVCPISGYKSTELAVCMQEEEEGFEQWEEISSDCKKLKWRKDRGAK